MFRGEIDVVVIKVTLNFPCPHCLTSCNSENCDVCLQVLTVSQYVTLVSWSSVVPLWSLRLKGCAPQEQVFAPKSFPSLMITEIVAVRASQRALKSQQEGIVQVGVTSDERDVRVMVLICSCWAFLTGVTGQWRWWWDSSRGPTASLASDCGRYRCCMSLTTQILFPVSFPYTNNQIGCIHVFQSKQERKSKLSILIVNVDSACSCKWCWWWIYRSSEPQVHDLMMLCISLR